MTIVSEKNPKQHAVLPQVEDGITLDVVEVEIGGVKQFAVDARSLHSFLEVGRDFANWVKQRIAKYDFQENVDYCLTLAKTGVRSNVVQKDYFLALDMAKELSMVENNEKGRAARRYFIRCEKMAFEAMKEKFLQPAIETRQVITPEQQDALHTIVDQRAGSNRKIRAEMWSRHNRHFNIAKYSQLLAIHFDDAVWYLENMELKGELPASNHSAFDLLAADTTNKVMDYYSALHREIKRLGGKAPEYPQFDKETIVRACVTRMVDMSRMLLTFNSRGNPQVSFISNNSWILDSDNIAQIIGDPSGPKKELLPEIIQAAVGRLSK